MIAFTEKHGWYKNSFGESVERTLQHIAPRLAGPYPDISLAGKNPMSVTLTERHYKSQDMYLLGKKDSVIFLRNFHGIFLELHRTLVILKINEL